MRKFIATILIAWAFIYGPFASSLCAQWAGILGASRSASGPTAVTIDTFARNYQNGNGSFTYSYSQGSVTTGYVIVMTGTLKTTATTCTVTYGGASMTKLDEAVSAGGRYCAIFGLAVGTSGSGSKSVVITWDGNVLETNAVTVSMSGANQGATPSTTKTVDGFSAAPSLNSATTTSNDMVFATFTTDNIGTGLTSGNITLDISDGSFSAYGNSRAVGTGSAVAMTWTTTVPRGYNTIDAVVVH